MRTGRSACLACCGFIVAAAAAGTLPIVVFPGPIRSVPSPNASGGRIFYQPRMLPDGSQASPVFYQDAEGRVQQVATLSRNMGISWSPDGGRVFLQDDWGSNIADCYVLTRTASGITGFRLSRLLQRTRGHPSAAEQRGHYYVHCDHWISPELISGAVSGHTDTVPAHDFNHSFTYNARTRRIVWTR
jgi:hypothetical protein